MKSNKEKKFSLSSFFWGPHLPQKLFEVPTREAIASLVQNASLIAGFSIAIIALILSGKKEVTSFLVLGSLFLSSMLLIKSCDCLNNSLEFKKDLQGKELLFYRRQVYWGWRHYNLAIIVIILSIMFIIVNAIAEAESVPCNLKLALYVIITYVALWWALFWFNDLWKTILLIQECDFLIQNYDATSVERPNEEALKCHRNKVLIKLSLYFLLGLGFSGLLALPLNSWILMLITVFLLIILRLIVASHFGYYSRS